MRKIRDILRLRGAGGLSIRQINASTKLSVGAIQKLLVQADALGLRDAVVFAGYITEAEKVRHFGLADVFLLAGWGEGFGIVLLEAMACGVPVVASRRDGSRASGGR